MNKTITLLLSILFMTAYSQKPTEEEMIDLAAALVDKEVLSEKGKEEFLKASSKLETLLGSHWSESSSKELITLAFLEQAFQGDFLYRIGFAEQEKFAKKAEENGWHEKYSESELASLYEKEMEKFHGYVVEEKIVAEDSVSESFSMPNMFLTKSSNLEKVIHDKRSALGKHRTRTINDLLDLGLIDEDTHTKMVEAIKKGGLPTEWHLLLALKNMAEDQQERRSVQPEIREYINDLHKIGLFSDESYEKVLLSNNELKITSSYDLLKYSKGTQSFSWWDEPEPAAAGYKHLFKQLEELVPELAGKELNFELEEGAEEWDEDLIKLEAVVSFKAGKNEYRGRFWYDYIKKKEYQGKEAVGFDFRREFLDAINKYLLDLGADYRLFSVPTKPEKEALLIRLKEEEYRVVNASKLNHAMYPLKYAKDFNTKEIKKALKSFKKIGLFEHLTDKEYEVGMNRVNESVISSYGYLLISFPKMIVFFDWETGNLENPYEELVTAFGEASRGVFNPQKIVDTFSKSWESDSTLLSFEANGKTYSKQLRMNSDWLDPEFMNLIMEAIKDSGSDGEFYHCLSDGQAGGSIFLTPKQLQFMQANYEGMIAE